MEFFLPAILTTLSPWSTALNVMTLRVGEDGPARRAQMNFKKKATLPELYNQNLPMLEKRVEK